MDVINLRFILLEFDFVRTCQLSFLFTRVIPPWTLQTRLNPSLRRYDAAIDALVPERHIIAMFFSLGSTLNA